MVASSHRGVRKVKATVITDGKNTSCWHTNLASSLNISFTSQGLHFPSGSKNNKNAQHSWSLIQQSEECRNSADAFWVISPLHTKRAPPLPLTPERTISAARHSLNKQVIKRTVEAETGRALMCIVLLPTKNVPKTWLHTLNWINYKTLHVSPQTNTQILEKLPGAVSLTQEEHRAYLHVQHIHSHHICYALVEHAHPHRK